MPELILPPGVARNYRPYRTASTEALMYELQQRQLIAELSGKIAMPKDPALDTEEKVNQMKLQQFTGMAQQLGLAAAQSPFCLSGSIQQPNPVDPSETDEILIMSLFVVMHPTLLKQMPPGYAPGPTPPVGGSEPPGPDVPAA